MNNNNNKKAPVYKMVLNENEEETFINVLSLVDDPAIMIDWVKFNESKTMELKLKVQSEEKKRIMSPVLLPDQYILRFDHSGKLTGKVNGEYYLFIDKDSIELAAKRFFKTYYNKTDNFNINHNPDQIVLNNQVYIMESWLTGKEDKSKQFGFNLPEGTWMITLQIEDDNTWSKIKDGILTGISMEGMFTLSDQINEVNAQYSKEEELLAELKKLLS